MELSEWVRKMLGRGNAATDEQGTNNEYTTQSSLSSDAMMMSATTSTQPAQADGLVTPTGSSEGHLTPVVGSGDVSTGANAVDGAPEVSDGSSDIADSATTASGLVASAGPDTSSDSNGSSDDSSTDDLLASDPGDSSSSDDGSSDDGSGADGSSDTDSVPAGHDATPADPGPSPAPEAASAPGIAIADQATSGDTPVDQTATEQNSNEQAGTDNGNGGNNDIENDPELLPGDGELEPDPNSPNDPNGPNSNGAPGDASGSSTTAGPLSQPAAAGFAAGQQLYRNTNTHSPRYGQAFYIEQSTTAGVADYHVYDENGQIVKIAMKTDDVSKYTKVPAGAPALAAAPVAQPTTVIAAAPVSGGAPISAPAPSSQPTAVPVAYHWSPDPYSTGQTFQALIDKYGGTREEFAANNQQMMAHAAPVAGHSVWAEKVPAGYTANVRHAGAAADLGSVDLGGVMEAGLGVLPHASNYHQSTAISSRSSGAVIGATSEPTTNQQPAGWGGSAETPPDPGSAAMAVEPHWDTDPLSTGDHNKAASS